MTMKVSASSENAKVNRFALLIVLTTTAVIGYLPAVLGLNRPLWLLLFALTTFFLSIFSVRDFKTRATESPGALEFLSRTLTQNLRTLPDGKCRYGFLLRDDGGVLDDLTCYRLGPDRFWLVVNAGTTSQDAAWVWQHPS